jgi:formylglycine-generating enzyme required for sulfatase activity
MRWVPGGTFRMGSEDFYPEERPARTVAVDGFWMDEHPVTVAEFRRFVKATGHVTVAEQVPDPADYPDADPAQLVPGSLVFDKPPGPVPLDDVHNWWTWVHSADWRHPEGPASTLHGRDRHPVTHVAHADAVAYLRWAGRVLPSEVEWERAARGGLDGAPFTWGEDPAPGGRPMANTWQGLFPWQNLRLDGFEGTSPVGHFPANGFGLRDMAGNVWEWTDDYFTPDHAGQAGSAGLDRPCCAPRNSRVSSPERSLAVDEPGSHLARLVIKGGSHLCAPNYCLRYRPAARQAETFDTSTSHLGFRGIARV